MDLSPQASARLARLKENYLRSLNDKRAAIESARQAAEAADFAPEALAEFRHLVHKLAGSAGTYGLEDIYRQAVALEDTLKALQDEKGERAALLGTMREQSDTLLTALSAAASPA